MSNLSYCGIDLAKNHFSVHAINQHGKVILHKNVTRTKLLNTIAKLPPMRIGMEACSGAHYWAKASQASVTDSKVDKSLSATLLN